MDRVKYDVLLRPVVLLSLKRSLDYLSPVELLYRLNVLVQQHLLEHELDLVVVRSLGKLDGIRVLKHFR